MSENKQVARVGASSQSTCTKEQLAVINARDVSLLVAASAGTGKTFTLTQRIVNRILDKQAPLDLERLLVVTFTDAAAKEMRDRIRHKLLEELEKDPDNAYLRLQVQKISYAKISTIDSFFREIIRKFSYMLGLEPSPPLIDEAQASVLRTSVLDKVFEELYEADDPNFIDLVDCYGRGVNDARLKDLVLRIYAYENSLPDIRRWESNVLSLWKCDAENLGDHPWVETVRQEAIQQLRSCLAKLNYCRLLCEESTGLFVYIPTLEEDLASIEASIDVLQSGGWTEVLTTLPTYGTLPRVKSDPDVRKKIQNIRSAVKKTTRKLQTEWFGRSLVDYAADFPQDLCRASCLLEIVSRLRSEYTELKQQLGVVDFADLAHLSLKILTKDADGPYGGPAAKELREQYDEVLIDEYQDTNQIQDHILALISRDLIAEGQTGQAPNRIMIGDVKQSIYRFRLADPRIFRQKLETYSDTSGPKRKIPLSKNFRSRKEILDATNFVFNQIMQSALVELDYGESDRLVCGAEWLHSSLDGTASPENEPVELYVLDKQGSSTENSGEEDVGSWSVSDGEDEQAVLGSFQREVHLAACRIRKLLGNALVFDDESKEHRPVRYGDMAILLRTAKDRSDVVMQVLREAGIPAVSMGKSDLFAGSEIKLLVSLLEVIDNPRRSPQLCMVLLSAIGGFSADDVAEIRLSLPSGELYDSLLVPVENPCLEEKRRAWLGKLRRWREMAGWCAVSDFVRWLLGDVGEGNLIQEVFDLPQRRENLKYFVALAEDYEHNHPSTLTGFVRYLEELRSSGGYDISTNAMDMQVDAVKIMTIHNSKGLEFPIVFLLDLGKPFNMQDAWQDVIFQQELGIGLKHVDLLRKEKWPTLSSLAVGIADRQASLAEEMRILYVAMTRARERLVLIGSVNLASAAQRWAMAVARKEVCLPENLILEARSPLDWICPAVMRHRDGQTLRDVAGYEYAPACIDLVEDPSCWYVSAGERPVTPGVEGELSKENDLGPNDMVWDSIKQLKPLEPVEGLDCSCFFDWDYEYQGLSQVKQVYAVTDLAEESWRGNRSLDPADVAAVGREVSSGLPMPRFAALADSETVTGAQRGTAVHKFIQLADLHPELAMELFVEKELDRLVKVGLLSAEEAQLVDPKIVARFFNSDLGQRFFTPGIKVERELEFTSALSVEELAGGHGLVDGLPLTGKKSNRGDFVILRGVIDCVLDFGSELVVVDFKTDRVESKQVNEYAARYFSQVRYYAKALEKIRGKLVSEKYLAFLTTGVNIQI